jgi:hypothetical protein
MQRQRVELPLAGDLAGDHSLCVAQAAFDALRALAAEHGWHGAAWDAMLWGDTHEPALPGYTAIADLDRCLLRPSWSLGWGHGQGFDALTIPPAPQAAQAARTLRCVLQEAAQRGRAITRATTRLRRRHGIVRREAGVADRVFVSGDAVRRSDPLHNYSLAAGERPAVGAYEGIIAAPLVDWDAGGIPLGVVYVTLAAMDGRLFGLPPRTAADPTGQTLDDLFEWLHLSARGALSVLGKMGRTGLGRQRLHPCYTLAGMAHLHPSCDAASSHKNLTSGPKMARQGAICSGTMQ